MCFVSRSMGGVKNSFVQAGCCTLFDEDPAINPASYTKHMYMNSQVSMSHLTMPVVDAPGLCPHRNAEHQRFNVRHHSAACTRSTSCHPSKPFQAYDTPGSSSMTRDASYVGPLGPPNSSRILRP
jgi:hypothetical protein